MSSRNCWHTPFVSLHLITDTSLKYCLFLLILELKIFFSPFKANQWVMRIGSEYWCCLICQVFPAFKKKLNLYRVIIKAKKKKEIASIRHLICLLSDIIVYFVRCYQMDCRYVADTSEDCTELGVLLVDMELMHPLGGDHTCIVAYLREADITNFWRGEDWISQQC